MRPPLDSLPRRAPILAAGMLVLVGAVDALSPGSRRPTLPSTPEADALIRAVPWPDAWAAPGASGRAPRLLPPWTRELPVGAPGWIRRADGRTRWFVPNEPVARFREGPWALLVRERAAAEATAMRWDLVEDVHRLRAGLQREEGELDACEEWRIDRWHCGPEPWLWVGPHETTIRGQSTRCLWMHPPEQGATFVQIPLAAGQWRVGLRAALSDTAAAAPDGPPVELVLELASGEALLQRTHRNRTGWTPLRTSIDLLEDDVLSVRVEAGSAGMRHVCVDGTIERVGDASVDETPPTTARPARPARRPFRGDRRSAEPLEDGVPEPGLGEHTPGDESQPSEQARDDEARDDEARDDEVRDDEARDVPRRQGARRQGTTTPALLEEGAP